MSEHDEPKTALTTTRPDPFSLPEGTPVLAWPGSRDSSPMLTRTRTPVFQTRSGDLLVSVDGHPGGIALTHIEVMPEGYTTSPAPEATGRCGYAIVDTDDIEEPCNRPATGWRWYQDVGDHEDLLDPACDHHENEGGRRMARLAAENERLRATLADVRAQHTFARRRLLALEQHPG